MKTLSVNIVLSCDHSIKETIETVMLKPEVGDLRACQKCISATTKRSKKLAYKRTIKNVGVPFWEGEDDVVKNNPEQASFLEELGLS